MTGQCGRAAFTEEPVSKAHPFETEKIQAASRCTPAMLMNATGMMILDSMLKTMRPLSDLTKGISK